VPFGVCRVLAVEVSTPALRCEEGWQAEAGDVAARERVSQTRVSDKPDATSLLTAARATAMKLFFWFCGKAIAEPNQEAWSNPILEGRF
jgi:hypothetical protein